MRFNLARAQEGKQIDASVAVEMESVAVGDVDGDALLSVGASDGKSTLLTGTGTPVKVRRLAALLNEHGIEAVTVMKIDVEGYEDRILPPYLLAVPKGRWPQAIIIEHAHADRWSVDCIAFCMDRGYRIERTTANNTILARQP